MANVIPIPEFLHLSSKFWPISGVNSMHCEYFCATPSWRQEGPRYDCIYVNSEPEFKGVCSLEITCVLVFFSFVANDSEDEYECALIHWFGTELDEKGLLLVEPAYDDDEILTSPSFTLTAYFVPHPYCQCSKPTSTSTMQDTLNTFKQFYVNKFVDYHAFEISI
jgi:hypothetical protein